MASIVQRKKALAWSTPYMTESGGEKKRQKRKIYYSYETALRLKEQLDLIQQHKKERLKYQKGTLAKFLEEYVELYGCVNWAKTNHSPISTRFGAQHIISLRCRSATIPFVYAGFSKSIQTSFPPLCYNFYH